MEEMEEHIIREHQYAENAERMKNVNELMKKSRIYNIYFNLAVSLLSISGIYLWLCYTNAGIKMALTLAEEVGTITFPWYAVTCFLTPPITIMSFFADNLLVKKLNRICQLLYLVILGFSAADLILKFEPMGIVGTGLLIIYALAGLWTQDMFIRCYKELDYLEKQEGFPDFNYGIEKDRHSKYVKYREKWLKAQKKQDYYTDNERPIALEELSITTPEDSSKMEGISVDSEKAGQWFEGKTTDKPPAEFDMEGLAADKADMPDDSEYVVDDPRKRPL